MVNHNPPTNGLDKRRGDINRKGQTVLPKEIKEARKLNKEVSFKIVQKYAWMAKDKIMAINPDIVPLYEQGIFRSFLNYAKTGDIKWIQFWADHLVGTPIAHIKQENTNTNINADFSKISTNKLQQAIEAIIEKGKVK